MALAENLRALMDERGETNYRLAKEVGVAQTSIANWLAGKTNPTPAYLRLLAAHFDVSVDDLLRKED